MHVAMKHTSLMLAPHDLIRSSFALRVPWPCCTRTCLLLEQLPDGWKVMELRVETSNSEYGYAYMSREVPAYWDGAGTLPKLSVEIVSKQIAYRRLHLRSTTCPHLLYASWEHSILLLYYIELMSLIYCVVLPLVHILVSEDRLKRANIYAHVPPRFIVDTQLI